MTHHGANTITILYVCETDLNGKIKLFCVFQQPPKSEIILLVPSILDYRDVQQWDGEKLGIKFS
jgi:hypothetical protein